MYFNRKLLIPTVALLAAGVANAGDCPQSVVKSMSDAEFLKYVLLNCVPVSGAGASTTNKLGKSVLDPQACIASFKIANPSITLSPGTCAGDYLNFVSNLQNEIKTAAHASPFQNPAAGVGDACTYDSTTDTISVSYVCWNRLSVQLLNFQQSAGYPMVHAPCDASTVRALTIANTLQTVITAALTAASGTAADRAALAPQDYRLAASGADGTSHIVVGKWAKVGGLYKGTGVDLNMGLCYGAYQTLLDWFQGSTVLSAVSGPTGIRDPGFGANNLGWFDSNGIALTSVQAACKTNINDPICSGSNIMGGIQTLFETMSGYSISFQGPMCDAAAISKLDNPTTRPTPYQFFVMCGLMSSQYPAQCSSASVANYVAELEKSVGSECNGCYDELYTKIQAFVTNTTATAVCNSLANVTSDACVAAMSPIAASFKNCTGTDLYTKVPSSIPDSSNTTGGDSNSTTDGTASSSADSRIISSSLVVIVAVLTYLM